MGKYKPGYYPDGTPKQPKKPSVAPGKKYGPDGTPIPQPKPEVKPKPEPKPEEKPISKSHRCKINGAFIVLGGYIQIFDNEVPAGQRGHELYLKFGGVGVGGMNGNGTLSIDVSSWDEFYNRVHSFVYIAIAPTMDISTSKMAHTGIVFYDGNSKKIGYAEPDVSADIGMAGGTVTVKS